MGRILYTQLEQIIQRNDVHVIWDNNLMSTTYLYYQKVRVNVDHYVSTNDVDCSRGDS
jgi:hypothetical protein